MKLHLFLFLLFPLLTFSQNFTTYFTGNNINLATNPDGGICLMGGATENDEAMKWFLNRCNGGDVLVLRASGSDGYNDYMYSELGVTINSVETIVCHNASAAQESYIHQKIQQAEAIWFAGGDQWNYISYWRDTPVETLINEAITNRNIVIGGTSAGMAIMGGYYFSAQNGTVTSATALNNPYDTRVTVDNSPFLNTPFLQDVITDTHYDNPDRKGRHITFLARIFQDWGIGAKGIACDEYTAVCIDGNGMARVFGEYPEYDDNAYFIQTNCELAEAAPEICTDGQALHWDRENMAIKVYKVKGTLSGENTFDLNDWSTGSGGLWEHWYVENGTLQETVGEAVDCSNPLSIREFAPIGAQWGLWYLDFSLPISYAGSIVVEKDTLFAGKNAKKLILDKNIDDNFLNGVGFVYQSVDSIFVYNPDLQDFVYAYNFNAQVGDTIFLRHAFMDNLAYKIDSVAVEMINNIPIKVQYVSLRCDEQDGFLEDYPLKIMEKIGPLQFGDFFFLENYCYTDGYEYRVRCYSDNEFPEYLTEWVHEGEDCLITSIDFIPNVNERYFKIYPNPTSNLLTIQMEKEITTPYQIQIFSLTGQLLFQKYYEASEVGLIDVTDWGSGMYLIKIRTNDTLFFQEKFIIK